jgi:hypothetical protein
VHGREGHVAVRVRGEAGGPGRGALGLASHRRRGHPGPIRGAPAAAAASAGTATGAQA